MKLQDIKRYLRPYSITRSRATTVNHAFAAAIAPSDMYDIERIRGAIELLGGDPDSELECAYCGKEAETWDHIQATVRAKKFSGFGHRIGNLLPCCKSCNSKKGNKDWREYLHSLKLPADQSNLRASRIEAYIQTSAPDAIPEHLPEYAELQQIREQVLTLLQRADVLAAAIREKSGAA